MSGIFGFSVQSNGDSDFLPVLRYDSRSGRAFRVDRVNTGGGFVSEPVDVTSGLKFIADLENVEVGWLLFGAGIAPDMRLVPIGHALPQRPNQDYKNGVRFMVKLAKEVGGDKPIREIASTARAFLSGVEDLYMNYEAQKAENPGKLPVVVLEKTVPVKSAQSVNYAPVFKIVSWAPRGDLIFQPKAASNGSAVAGVTHVPGTPPSTGSTRVDPPGPRQTELDDVNGAGDFG